jgi:hypothetical protein
MEINLVIINFILLIFDNNYAYWFYSYSSISKIGINFNIN